MKFEKLQVGMKLWRLKRYAMGNTKLRTVDVELVTIVAIYHNLQQADVAINGYQRRWWKKELEKLRVQKPELVTTGLFGQQRLKRRDETIIIRNSIGSIPSALSESSLGHQENETPDPDPSNGENDGA